MPYSRVTRTAFGADAIAYVLGAANDGKGHNGSEVRNRYIGCVNMLPNEVVPFTQQMQTIWNKATARHTTQINRYTISFALSELDPDEPTNWGIAGVIGERFAKKIAPDNQAVVTVQDDGKGGKLHTHIFINDGRIPDGKGIESWTYHHADFRPIVDEICQQYFDLAEPEELPEKINLHTRNARIVNEQIRAANKQEKKLAEEEGRDADLTPEIYIWQDDLRQRVITAATKAKNEADFAHQLRLSGVELVPCKDRKTDKPKKDKNGNIIYLHPGTKRQPEYYTYELTDITGFPGKIPMNLKSKSHKLGTKYSPEEIAKLFDTKSKEEQEQEAPPVVLETPLSIPSRKKKEDTKPAKKPANDEAMAEATKAAKSYALAVMQQVYGWEDVPKREKPDGTTVPDVEEMGRQFEERDIAFEQFKNWRKDRQDNGEKLPTIYVKDKATGHISVPRDELEAQFRDFLDQRDHPEKYVAAQEQQEDQSEQAAPMDQHQEEQQQPAPIAPTPAKQQQTEPEKLSQAEQERQEVAAQYSALFQEVQRINAESERRWEEQEGEEEDTVVKR